MRASPEYIVRMKYGLGQPRELISAVAVKLLHTIVVVPRVIIGLTGKWRSPPGPA
jgi:hypothetical protein